MRFEKNRKILGIDEYTLMRAGKFLIIPAIILVLTAVIIISDIKDAREAKAAEAGETQASQISDMTAADTADGQEVLTDEKQYINTFDDYGLQKDSVPEIVELVEAYQNAKLSGDVDALYKVFGRTDSEGKEKMQERLQSEKEAFESYEDTACYITPALEEGSYLTFIYTRLKFKGVDTAAPMLMWAYCIKGTDGYYMLETEQLTQDQEAYVDKISATEDVTVLDNNMKKELTDAVMSDTKLAALYEIWSNPEIEEARVLDTSPHLSSENN